MGAALVLLGARNWIIAGHGLSQGAWEDPLVLLANKLAGWLHLGTVLDRWSWEAALAGIFWEWLPALLFAWGLSLRLRGTPAPPLPSLPPRAYPWVPALLLLLVALPISRVVFEGIPHVQDSIAQQFQAQVFARGKAWVPVPPEGWVLRSEYMVQHHGRWFSQYPPGHAAMLAIGVVLGVPWLVTPALGALSAVFFFAAARQMYGRRTARLALWLFCLSPFVWFMSGERMNHVTTLFWVCAALYFLAPALRARSPLPTTASLLLGGLALGLAVSTRPLCGVAVGVPLAGAALLRLRFSHPAGGFALAVGGILGALPLLLFNNATTGSPWVTGYQVQWGSSGWGFGQAQWGSPHTLGAGLAHLASNWDGAAKYLLEWPLPGLLPLLGCFLLPRLKRVDRVLLAVPACLSAAYLPYFYQDLCLGPRFLYAAVPALLLLSARGVSVFGASVARLRREPPRLGQWKVREAVGLLILAGLLANLPPLLAWYGREFWGASTRLVREVERRGIRRAVVFIRDYGRLRCEELRRRGVPLAVAQAAVDRLDPAWVDARIAEWDASSAPQRTRGLTGALGTAVGDPLRGHRRTQPAWVDPAGPSSNVSLGFWANTPWPAEQDVVYALHPGSHFKQVGAAFSGRSFWVYGWNPVQRRFELQPWVDHDRTRSADGERREREDVRRGR